VKLEISNGVSRIGHIALRVKDLERSKSFYVNLGMKLIWDDKDWCYLEAGIGKDGLALLGPSYKTAGPHLAFHFEDKKEVEKIHYDLENSGIKVGRIHEHRDGTASFYMQDTEENWLEMLYVPKGGIKSNL
tara:strand:- start:5408 stop:5800 length:393 start_codon:yes stop_codon:yes gene_type:complete